MPVSVIASKNGHRLILADHKDRKPNVNVTVARDSAAVTIVDKDGKTKFLVQEGDPSITTEKLPTVEGTIQAGVFQMKRQP